jgi:hypothetical protein
MVYRPHVIFMNFTCPVFIPPSVNCQFYSPLEYYSAHFTEVLLLAWLGHFPCEVHPSLSDLNIYSILVLFLLDDTVF